MGEKLYTDDSLRRYIKSGSQSVPGMLQSGSMSLLWTLIASQDDLGVTGNVAEIGVYKGKLLILLALALSADEKAYGFDIFRYDNKAPEQNRNLLHQALDRFGIPEQNRQIFIADTRRLDKIDLLRVFGGKTVRLFSVDGDHSKLAVIHDLQLATGTTRDAGVIIADDIFNAWYPGVTEAIFEFFRTLAGPWEPIAIAAANGPLVTGAAKLFIAHADYANTYKRYLQVLNQANYRWTAKLLGFDVLVFDFDRPVVKAQLNEKTRKRLEELADQALS